VAYDEAFLRLPHLELIGKFSNAYSSPIKWLIPGYYRQRRILKAVRLDGALPDSILQDLRSALDLNKEEARLAAQKENDRKVLGRLYKGLQTDFDEVGQALEVARKALGLMGISPVSPELRAILSRGGVVPENVRQMGAALSNEVAELEADLKGLEDLVSITKLPQSDVALELSPLEAIDKWVKDCRIFLNSFCSQLEPILLAAQFEGLTCEILQQDLEQISEARRIDEWMTRKEHSLREQIGPKFSGYATLWNELLSALSWAQSFIQLHNGTAIPEPVMQMAVKGHATHSSTAELKALISEYDHSWKILLTRFATGYPRYTSVNLNSLPLGQFQDRLDLMIERVDDIEDWIKFQDIRSAFKQLSADQILESLVHEAAKIGANQLRGVVNKSVLSAWLDKAIAGDPPLRQFRTYEHSKVVEEFRSLDNRLRDASPKRVIEEARRLRPIPSGFINGGEAQILLREGNKQRRLLPIRKLFVQIPMLVKQIKPCLLMSPMSLSQFLEPQSLTFDLVVFDEASQVRPEDAIGAVYRGRQIVVCGDNKQLPPSSFFDVGTAEDEYDDDEENPEAAVDSFESILDDCSKCVPTKMLQWHYRSAHESLIAFSNRRFYQNRLTIFPSSVREDQELGVTFVHVPDGVYTPRRRSERDETRAGTNQKEAEKVVELVAEHIRSHFERSLGVVAFSQSQADAIENSLETYRKTHPEHEEFFGNNRNERFFVNPLEKVQGDERDVMILSVGYARDQYGKFSMNFGPINKQGGERRLNVAVTRARRKLYIVSSVTSADFNLRAGLSAGALLLHKYLDYAERGYKVLETEVGNDDTESPLEDSIAGAVRMLGYEVDCQVGVGGYRIDIGVRDRLLPGRYILGIECDGATYHSSKVSRDRDRLRQEVLEKMGWRIHRIWSTNWVVKRKSEEQRLQSAIEEALKVAQSTYGMRGPLNENVKRDASADPSVTSISVAGELLEGAPDWCTPYEVFSLPRRRRTPLDVNDVKNHTQIRAIILDIVVKEGPVHEEIVLARTCEACGMDRVGGKVRNVFEHIIKKLVKDRELVTGGVFIRARGQTLKAVRTPTDDPESKRLISQIPPEEIQLNLEKITQAAFSIDRQSLIVQVARIFGFDRVGGIIGEVIGGEVDTLLQNGRLVFERGRLSTQK